MGVAELTAVLGERPFKRAGAELRNIDRYRLGISSVPSSPNADAAAKPMPPPPSDKAEEAEQEAEAAGGPPLPVAG